MSRKVFKSISIVLAVMILAFAVLRLFNMKKEKVMIGGIMSGAENKSYNFESYKGWYVHLVNAGNDIYKIYPRNPQNVSSKSSIDYSNAGWCLKHGAHLYGYGGPTPYSKLETLKDAQGYANIPDYLLYNLVRPTASQGEIVFYKHRLGIDSVTDLDAIFVAQQKIMWHYTNGESINTDESSIEGKIWKQINNNSSYTKSAEDNISIKKVNESKNSLEDNTYGVFNITNKTGQFINVHLYASTDGGNSYFNVNNYKAYKEDGTEIPNLARYDGNFYINTNINGDKVKLKIELEYYNTTAKYWETSNGHQPILYLDRERVTPYVDTDVEYNPNYGNVAVVLNKKSTTGEGLKDVKFNQAYFSYDRTTPQYNPKVMAKSLIAQMESSKNYETIVNYSKDITSDQDKEDIVFVDGKAKNYNLMRNYIIEESEPAGGYTKNPLKIWLSYRIEDFGNINEEDIHLYTYNNEDWTEISKTGSGKGFIRYALPNQLEVNVNTVENGENSAFRVNFIYYDEPIVYGLNVAKKSSGDGTDVGDYSKALANAKINIKEYNANSSNVTMEKEVTTVAGNVVNYRNDIKLENIDKPDKYVIQETQAPSTEYSLNSNKLILIVNKAIDSNQNAYIESVNVKMEDPTGIIIQGSEQTLTIVKKKYNFNDYQIVLDGNNITVVCIDRANVKFNIKVVKKSSDDNGNNVGNDVSGGEFNIYQYDSYWIYADMLKSLQSLDTLKSNEVSREFSAVANSKFYIAFKEMVAPNGYANKIDGLYGFVPLSIDENGKISINTSHENYQYNYVNPQNNSIGKSNFIKTDLMKVETVDGVQQLQIVITDPPIYDLALRKFITKIDNKDVTNRAPVVDTTPLVKGTGTTANYTHTKEPELVAQDQIVTYKLRIYNEGKEDAYASLIKDDIPDGLEFVTDSEINKKYGWKLVDENDNEVTDISKAKYIVTNYLAKNDTENDTKNDTVESNDDTKSDAATAIWNYLTKEKGYNNYVTAGIMGNMMMQSRLDYKMYSQDNRNFYGLCQWNIAQYPELKEMNLEQQLDFLVEDMKKTIPLFGKYTYESFTNINNVDEASYAFHDFYIRPSTMSNREKVKEYANTIYDKYSTINNTNTDIDTNIIKGFNPDTMTELDYKDVEVQFKVLEPNTSDRVIINYAQISEETDDKGNIVTDRDSTPNEWKGEDDEDIEKIKVKTKYYDLALRKFITKVDDKEITDRAPVVDIAPLVDGTGTTANYTHPKDPEVVAQNQIVTYTLRTYNEGREDAYASIIKDDIPDGLEFVIDSEINKKYGWKLVDENDNEVTDSSKAKYIVTKYLSKEVSKDNIIKGFNPDTMTDLDYKDVEVQFKVLEPNTSDRVIINYAQISEETDDKGNTVTDRDSTPNEWKGEDDEDIEKIRVQYFDLALRKWVTQAIVTENGKSTVINTGHKAEDNPEAVVKVDLKKSKLNDVIVKFRYSIRVTNEGEIAGEATEVSDYIPNGLKFVQEDNPDWRLEDGKVVTNKLAGTTLQPGESAEVEIVLTWVNSESNMGVMVNMAEISKDHNNYGTPDIDSTPNNKVIGEDDIDDAPVMITIKTGSEMIGYVSLLFGFVAIIVVGVNGIKKLV